MTSRQRQGHTLLRLVRFSSFLPTLSISSRYTTLSPEAPMAGKEQLRTMAEVFTNAPATVAHSTTGNCQRRRFVRFGGEETVTLTRLKRAIDGVRSSLDWVMGLAPDAEDTAVLVQAAEALSVQRDRIANAVEVLRDMARVLDIAGSSDAAGLHDNDDDQIVVEQREPGIVVEKAKFEESKAEYDEEPDDDETETVTSMGEAAIAHTGVRSPTCTWCLLPMVSSHSTFRIVWDLLLAVLLLVLVVIEPLALGYLPNSATHRHTVVGVLSAFIDCFFIIDLILNFRTGFTPRTDAVEVMDPELCAIYYLKTWFLLDFVSSVPPIVELVLLSAQSGGSLHGLKSAKLLKFGRVVKIFKVLRVAKFVKFSKEESSLYGFVEDVLSSASSMLVLRLFLIIAACLILAHVIACYMAVVGDGWFRAYSAYGDDETGEDWSWTRKYVLALYFTFTTLTTVGFGDVTPATTNERWFTIAAMLIGVAFYSYILATVSSVVTSNDAKSAIYSERMDQLSSWMLHHHFDAKLRRRTRAFFKRYYAQRSAINERTILENLAPSLQDEISQFLLHDYVKDHTLFRELPAGVLWRVLLITRTVSFERGAVVVQRLGLSLGLYIMLAGKATAEYHAQDARQSLRPSKRRFQNDEIEDDDGTAKVAQLRPGAPPHFCLFFAHI